MFVPFEGLPEERTLNGCAAAVAPNGICVLWIVIGFLIWLSGEGGGVWGEGGPSPPEVFLNTSCPFFNVKLRGSPCHAEGNAAPSKEGFSAQEIWEVAE